MKQRNKNMDAYFTVEASLVMPIVFMCYLAIVLFLCYIYERCMWEQNACRLPVWLEYAKGYAALYPGEAEGVSGEDICDYLQYFLKEEEAPRYLFGTDISAEITWRGDSVRVNRGLVFAPFGEWQQGFQVTVYCPDPEDYLRTTGWIHKIMEKNEEDEGKEDDKE